MATKALLIDLVARVLAESNEWAEGGTVYDDPEEWRVEARHVVDALKPYLKVRDGD